MGSRDDFVNVVVLTRAMLEIAGVSVDRTGTIIKHDAYDVPNDYRTCNITQTRHGTPPDAFVHETLEIGSNDAAGPSYLDQTDTTTYVGDRATLRLCFRVDYTRATVIVDVAIEAADDATADAMRRKVELHVVHS